jgi:hypothetical protein
MVSSTKSLTKEKTPIRYRLQMKLVQKYNDKTTNKTTTGSIWCGKPIECGNLHEEINAMLPHFIEKVMKKAKI